VRHKLCEPRSALIPENFPLDLKQWACAPPTARAGHPSQMAATDRRDALGAAIRAWTPDAAHG
jgi:hypothetical protein